MHLNENSERWPWSQTRGRETEENNRTGERNLYYYVIEEGIEENI
jgi:hypothetical protein